MTDPGPLSWFWVLWTLVALSLVFILASQGPGGPPRS